MGLRKTTTEWGSLSKALHWLIAIGLFALIYLGLEQASMGPGDEKSNMRFIHASTATILLILMTLGTAGRGLPLFGLTSIPLPIAKDEAGHEFWDVLRRMTHGVK